MKKLSRKKLLSMSLEELGFSIRDNAIDIPQSKQMIGLNHLGIQLEPDMPEVTQENLCKFYLKFKGWPKAQFHDHDHFDDDEWVNGFLMSWEIPYTLSYEGVAYDDCKITDERWPCIDHDSCELCEGVREIREKIKEIGG